MQKSTKQELEDMKQQLKHTEQKLSELKGVHQRVKKELRDAKKNEAERSAVMEEISANLKEKERKNVILNDLFQKTNKSAKNAENAMEYCQKTAVIARLYWESAKTILGDVLESESFSVMADTIAEIIMEKCEIMNAEEQTLSDEVVFHTKVYGYYLAETHLKECTAYSRAFFEQLRRQVVDSNSSRRKKKQRFRGKARKRQRYISSTTMTREASKGITRPPPPV